MREESQKINELDQETVKTITATEDQKTQATGCSQSTQALKGRSEELNDICERESFNLYMSLQQYLNNVEVSYENFKGNDSLKDWRFECQKEVNICVNALSAGTADHLKDKLFRMSRLIAGQHMEFGHGQVLASSHPEAIAFSRNLLAKKFICQGASNATTNPKLMFAYGAVIEALWADFPDFGQLMLANFYRECPYLVPIFMPQVEGQSTEDYKKSLGYHYNKSGEVETQEEFQRRMTGIIRLYAAVLISDPCGHQQNRSHPHGLSQAWRWMSCMLSMDLNSDICPTLLLDFLEVAGSAMYCHYGQQFQELCKQYFPKILKITPTGAAMLRLICFLKKILKQGHIPPPAGLLPPNFW
jgi:nucleoporin GLE1